MPKTFNVSVADQRFTVTAGARLLDAALQNGVDMRHDCRAGQCGACTVELTRGITLGGEVGCGNILACQARVFSDLEITPHEAPETVQRNGVIEHIRDLAKGVVEVVLRPRRPMVWLPGQYMKLAFRGYPARSFSPTARLEDGAFDDRLIFHIKQVRGGLVTPKLGGDIGIGSKVRIEGPYGHAFLRDGEDGHLVLLGSGTGFAPIWAIASAAQRRSPERRITMVCGAKDAGGLYMDTALLRAEKHPGTSVRVVLETPHPKISGLSFGTPADHMPALGADDIVFAAGGPRMVEMAREKAERAGARFYADPFTTSATPRTALTEGWKQVARIFGAKSSWS